MGRPLRPLRHMTARQSLLDASLGVHRNLLPGQRHWARENQIPSEKDFPLPYASTIGRQLTHKTIPRGVWLKSGARKSGMQEAAKSSQFVATAQQSWPRSNHFNKNCTPNVNLL